MRKIPQFDLPATANAFNLRSETTTDGARLQQERQAREEAVVQSAARQPDLFAPPAPVLQIVMVNRADLEKLLGPEIGDTSPSAPSAL